MNKLFVFQNDADPRYANELEQVYGIVNKRNNVNRININELTINKLNNIYVVISNQLPYEWIIILKGLKIVSVVFDYYRNSDELTDINIDYLYKGKYRLFSGEKFKISNHTNLDIEYDEIFDLISKLDWDSNFWGFNVAYLSSRHLSESILYRINNFITKNQIRLVEYLCDCHDRKSVELAERSGFEFKDIRLTYEKKLSDHDIKNIYEGLNFFIAGYDHIPILRKLSKDIYKDSRYYFDRNFDEKKTAEFYMLWAEKAVKGEYDNECYVIEINHEIIGFCTVKYEDTDLAHIGLVGISNNHSGKGLGENLINCFFTEMKNKGIKIIHVVTQGRNYAAQRLYQKVGFLSYSTEIWYHKWNY